MKGFVRKFSVRGLFALSALVTIGAFPCARNASAQSLGASIAGTVKDSNGVALPGVALIVKNLENDSIRSTITDASGAYAAVDLVPAAYEIVAVKDGFATAKGRLVLSGSTRLRSDLTLQPAIGPETVLALVKDLASMKTRMEQLETELQE